MSNGMKKVGLLAAVTAAVAGAAAFFLGTKKGQDMTKKAMTKTEEMVNEVAMKLRDAGDVTEDKYHEIVEAAAATWAATKDITTDEIRDAKTHLNNMWQDMKSGVQNKLHDDGHGHKCDHC